MPRASRSFRTPSGPGPCAPWWGGGPGGLSRPRSVESGLLESTRRRRVSDRQSRSGDSPSGRVTGSGTAAVAAVPSRSFRLSSMSAGCVPFGWMLSFSGLRVLVSLYRPLPLGSLVPRVSGAPVAHPTAPSGAGAVGHRAVFPGRALGRLPLALARSSPRAPISTGLLEALHMAVRPMESRRWSVSVRFIGLGERVFAPLLRAATSLHPRILPGRFRPHPLRPQSPDGLSPATDPLADSVCLHRLELPRRACSSTFWLARASRARARRPSVFAAASLPATAPSARRVTVSSGLALGSGARGVHVFAVCDSRGAPARLGVRAFSDRRSVLTRPSGASGPTGFRLWLGVRSLASPTASGRHGLDPGRWSRRLSTGFWWQRAASGPFGPRRFGVACHVYTLRRGSLPRAASGSSPHLGGCAVPATRSRGVVRDGRGLAPARPHSALRGGPAVAPAPWPGRRLQLRRRRLITLLSDPDPGVALGLRPLGATSGRGVLIRHLSRPPTVRSA